jgi:hypothetical protein
VHAALAGAGSVSQSVSQSLLSACLSVSELRSTGTNPLPVHVPVNASRYLPGLAPGPTKGCSSLVSGSEPNLGVLYLRTHARTNERTNEAPILFPSLNFHEFKFTLNWFISLFISCFTLNWCILLFISSFTLNWCVKFHINLMNLTFSFKFSIQFTYLTYIYQFLHWADWWFWLVIPSSTLNWCFWLFLISSFTWNQMIFNFNFKFVQ